MKDHSKEITLFKDKVIEKAVEAMHEYGQMPTLVLMFGYNHNTNDYMTGKIDVPPELMGCVEGKDLVAEILIPMVFHESEQAGIEVLCFNWTAEAWAREAPNDGSKEIPENWKELPKKEVLLLSFETRESSEQYVYNMERLGKDINAGGDLVDRVKLHPRDIHKTNAVDAEGRFTGMFRRYDSALAEAKKRGL